MHTKMAANIQGSHKTKVTHMASDDFQVKAFRKALKLNQSEFWKPLGVGQSLGSRYEHGRRIPNPTRILMTIVYSIPDEYLIPI